MVEQQLIEAMKEKEVAKVAYDNEAKLQEVTVMLKEVVEENSKICVDWDIRNQQVYQLWRKLNVSMSQPVALGTLPPNSS